MEACPNKIDFHIDGFSVREVFVRAFLPKEGDSIRYHHVLSVAYTNTIILADLMSMIVEMVKGY